MGLTARLLLLAVLAAAALLAVPKALATELEGLEDPDDDEPAVSVQDIAVNPSAADLGSPVVKGDGERIIEQEEQCQEQCAAKKEAEEKEAKQTRRRLAPARPRNIYLEITAAVVAALYVVVALVGGRSNRQRAEAWAQHYAGRDGLLPKNFAKVGMDTGDGTEEVLLSKESASQYKSYASGRRHCEGMLVSLNLKPRQDLLSMIVNLFMPKDDCVEMEVYMHESNMPPIVLAVGTPRQAKWLQNNRSDIKRYTKAIKVGNELSGKWNNTKLQVLAEHSTMFHELFTDPRVQSIFTSPAYADQLRYFRYLHFTSENSEGSHKRVLRFNFALPPADDPKAIAALMGLVPLFIDLVGIYKLTPELKKKALDARAKGDAEHAEDARKARQEALQERKLQKMQEEKERLARMPPEARRKAEDKLARQQAKKAQQQRVKMVRM